MADCDELDWWLKRWVFPHFLQHFSQRRIFQHLLFDLISLKNIFRRIEFGHSFLFVSEEDRASLPEVEGLIMNALSFQLIRDNFVLVQVGEFDHFGKLKVGHIVIGFDDNVPDALYILNFDLALVEI